MPRRRLKYAVEGCFNGIWGEEPNGADDDVVVVRVADFDKEHGQVLLGDFPTVRAVPESYLARRLLSTGDLLIEKSGGGEQAPVGNVVMFNHDIRAVCSNFVARMPVVPQCEPRFVRYVFQALYAAGRNLPHVKQTSGIQNLDSESYLNELAWLPEKGEQERIANFLDEKTARIDALIAEKEGLLGAVASYVRGEVSRLLTEGMQAARSQPTGNAYVPRAPKGWRVTAFKRVLFGIEQGWSPQCENRPAETDEWGVLKVGCVNGEAFDATENKALPTGTPPDLTCVIRKNDVLVSRANTRELVGMAALVERDYPNLLLCDKLYRLALNPEQVRPDFAVLVLRIDASRRQIELGANGASFSMQNISQDVIRDLVVALPPIEEQGQLVEQVRVLQKSALDLVLHVHEHLARLREYRSSLISTAVTGQTAIPT